MTLVETLVKHAVGLGAKILESKLLKEESKTAKKKIVPKNLSSHLNYVTNWSARIQFMGLGTAKDTDTQSIDLHYHETARKFRGRSSDKDIKTEDAMRIVGRHHILIGDPGAGKTTSLKRIARALFLSEPSSNNLEAHYPILVRLKEIDAFTNLYELFAELLGFSIEIKERITIEEKKITYKDDEGRKRVRFEKIEKKEPYAAIGETELKLFIINFLEESRALILLDGLDEAIEEIVGDLIRNIRELALKLTNGKLIVASRTGFYYNISTIEGLDVLDILPLDSDQILAMAEIWTESPSSFIKALKTSPYRDLANRPLLLSQLLFIFDRYGMLQKQPREIYQLIVELLLKEWDADRNIVRVSQYSGFSPKRKSEFLAELAFNLMYTNKTTQFDSSELKEIYGRICQKYELLKDEADNVAGEIESHTGIVVSSGRSKYEFSHLSIQEYLCADYIVRSPITRTLTTLLHIRPEPVAIAIALASDSTSWFCNIFTDEEAFDELRHSISTFVSRLVVERPVFRPDDLMGFCILYLYRMFPTKKQDISCNINEISHFLRKNVVTNFVSFSTKHTWK